MTIISLLQVKKIELNFYCYRQCLILSSMTKLIKADKHTVLSLTVNCL